MNLTAKMMEKALFTLATKLTHPVELIIGGGGAMILAHHFPLATTDIDGIPSAGVTAEELDPWIKVVALELGLSSDWLNPYYVTFTHVLPNDYASRLQTVFEFPNLVVKALSKEDLLIMKCFAGRLKDQPHARALLKKGVQIDIVEKQLEKLKSQRIPGAQEALDFLDEILDMV